MSADGVLDIGSIKGLTVRRWLEKKAEGYKRRAQELLGDADSQAIFEARGWEMKAEAIYEVIKDVERIDWPSGHIGRLMYHPDRELTDHVSNEQ